MKYIIDTEVLEKHGLSLGEFGILLYYADNNIKININTISENLWNKGYLIKEINNTFYFDNPKFEELQAILAEGTNSKNTNKRAEELAQEMREIFPEGSKKIFIRGVEKKYPWRDSNRIISNRLKIFFKRYGNNFTDGQIIDATKRYVSGFEGDTTYMKLLKYFIFKDDKACDGAGESYIDESSELLNYIENPEKIGGTNNDNGELV